MQYEIVFEREKCTACGACAQVSTNWTLDTKDGYAQPLKRVITKEQLAENKQAAQVCPAFCIGVKPHG